MFSGYRHTAIVQPDGLIQVEVPDLPAGTTVEVIVLIDSPTAALPLASDVPAPEALCGVQRHQFEHLRNQIVEADIPLLGDDQIEQEVARRRSGDYDQP